MGIREDARGYTEGAGISWAKVHAAPISEITGLKHHAIPL